MANNITYTHQDFSMLKILLFLSSFSILSSSASELSQLSFDDNVLTQCVLQIAKKNNWTTIEDIKKIKCHGMKIKNIRGINKLTALESLSLYNNKIKSADLSKLSQLTYINIANNKLRKVDVTGLTNLKTLYLFKNKLTTVDFTGLTQLEKVRITNNKLIELDISPLISLQKAYFFDNKLKDLIIKGLPKLKFIEIKQNPMSDEVYDRYDALEGITIIHEGNADDWK